MTGWIIASPKCNHFAVIGKAIQWWRRGGTNRTREQRRIERFRNLSHLMVNPNSGTFAEDAVRWAKAHHIAIVEEGQPDVIFVCSRRLWQPQALQELTGRYNPGRIVQIKGTGELTELPMLRRPQAGGANAMTEDIPNNEAPTCALCHHLITSTEIQGDTEVHDECFTAFQQYEAQAYLEHEARAHMEVEARAVMRQDSFGLWP